MLQRLLTKFAGALDGATVERSESEQLIIDEQTQRLALYHFTTCPYCVRVRRTIQHLKLDIALRDINRFPQYRQELIAGGGRSMVPCLRIENPDGTFRWMYESADINQFLSGRFGDQ